MRHFPHNLRYCGKCFREIEEFLSYRVLVALLQCDRIFGSDRAFFQPLGERLALNAFHHQIIDPVLMADVVQHADVRMIQARDDLGFLFEALLAHGITRKLFRQDFEGNGALQPRIPCTITSPIPPAPRGETISYGPSLWPGARDISDVIIALEESLNPAGPVNAWETK